MENKYRDKLLHINTETIINWYGSKGIDYNRTESTPYFLLDELFKGYEISDNDVLVDFGCGLGRILFYMSYKFNIKVKGIELNKESFQHLQANKISFEKNYPNKDVEIINDYVENYKVKREDNLFYFFNPFTINIFKIVIDGIELSLKDQPRKASIILYYPSDEYIKYLEKSSTFKRFKTVRFNQYNDRSEKFVIFSNKK